MSDQFVYVVRHCKATGQEKGCTLTEEGFKQSEVLADFFDDIVVDQIISSPYTRAIQSIIPTAERKRLDLYVNNQLSERVLSDQSLSDWMEKLESTFKDFNLQLPGGESSREAQIRGLSVIENIKLSLNKSTILVSHGNLISLILNYFDSSFGFNEWQRLSNPDVYQINLNKSTIERIWVGS